MIIGREKCIQFLQEELNKQTEDFKLKLDTSAVDLLLNKNEVFLALFVNFMANGEMILKFPASRPLPRKNDFFYCFTLPNAIRSYKNWGGMSYRNLIERETKATEVKCIWQSTSDDSNFYLVGFKGVSEDFREYIEKVPNGVVTLGPNVPPFEYLANLIKISKFNHPKCAYVLDMNYETSSWAPTLLDSNSDLISVLRGEYKNTDVVVLQGPPGTGKTSRISDLCSALCAKGKSVLVTALTNRALMEVAVKLKDTQLMTNSSVFKTNLTTDESREVPKLQVAENVHAMPGKLMLSTFYTTSGVAANNIDDLIFDYVIVDEASQAFLPMLAAANMLGDKNLWVGDIRQMPPVVQLSRERIKRMRFEPVIEGLDTIVNSNKHQIYQLTDTFRLGTRAAKFTGLFYNNTLKSKSVLNGLFEQKDGPIVLPIDMTIGDIRPANAIEQVVELVEDLLSKDKKLEIAILSHQIKTVEAIQTEVAKQIGMKKNILVETVARVQGITKDVTIYLIPDTDSKLYCLESRLFNVATSRAKMNTYIICPKNILDFSYMPTEVRLFLSQLF